MIDFVNYIEQKNKGALIIQKVGTRIMLLKRQFDAHTGDENEPLVGHINPQEIHKNLADAEKAVQGIKAFISDVESLGVKVVQKV